MGRIFFALKVNLFLTLARLYQPFEVFRECLYLSERANDLKVAKHIGLEMQPNQERRQIKPGIRVKIVLKQHQRSGKLTGASSRTSSPTAQRIPTESRYDL
jgi:hypothetical protein